MIEANGLKYFGYFKGQPYNKERCIESLDDYRTIRNKTPKEKVIEYFHSIPAALTSEPTYDLITGERIQAGLYIDGDFAFPTDFVYYYEKYDIGIPYEYEEYLINNHRI